MVPDEGIEPPTFGLQNRCSTAELIRRAVTFGVLAANGGIGALPLQRKPVCENPDNSPDRHIWRVFNHVERRCGAFATLWRREKRPPGTPVERDR